MTYVMACNKICAYRQIEIKLLRFRLNGNKVLLRKFNLVSERKYISPKWNFVAKLKQFSLLGSKRRQCMVLLGFSPFSLFKRKIDAHNAASPPEILSKIPKDVFKRDVIRKRPAYGYLRLTVIKLWDIFRLTTRFLFLVCIFSPFLVSFPLTYTSEGFNKLWLKLLLYTLEVAGPTFIKLGQWIGTRRDIFSKELCDHFSKLHDSTGVHSWYFTKKKLRKAFGKKWRLLFEKFEQTPIGSGCIAQVHRAYMCSDMIPDEHIVEEVLSLEDSDDPEIDFAAGLEVFGLLSTDDTKEEKEIEQERGERRKTRLDSKNPQTIEEKVTPKCQEQEVEGLHENYPNENIEIVEELETIKPIEMEEVTLIPVAVKVLHPGIYRQVSRDLKILRFLARFLEFCIPSLKWISISESCEEFTKLMIRQIDLRYEADCLEQFVANFESNPHVRFPKPIRPYCKRDALIETLEEGEHISQFLAEEMEEEYADATVVVNKAHVKHALAAIGVDALLQMIFVHNFVHGDLHPGNILVQNAQDYVPQEESKLLVMDVCDTVIVATMPVESPLRLVMLDVGISTSLAPSDLANLRNVITAVILKEDDKVAELMLQHARHEECQDYEAFRADMAGVVKKFRQTTIQLGKVQVGELLASVFSTCRSHRVKMESNFASVMLAIFVLEGIGRSLDPELDILDHAKTILLSKVPH